MDHFTNLTNILQGQAQKKTFQFPFAVQLVTHIQKFLNSQPWSRPTRQTSAAHRLRTAGVEAKRRARAGLQTLSQVRGFVQRYEIEIKVQLLEMNKQMQASATTKKSINWEIPLVKHGLIFLIFTTASLPPSLP